MKDKKKKEPTPEFRKKTNCLLLITHSPQRMPSGGLRRKSRRFFTPKKNFKYLIEFGKAYAAEIYAVQARNVNVLPLPLLAKALCDPTYDETAKYDIIENLLPTRNTKLRAGTNSVQRRIREKLLKGSSVSVKGLHKKLGVSESTIRRHLTIVRDDLEAEGRKVISPNRGYYQLMKLR